MRQVANRAKTGVRRPFYDIKLLLMHILFSTLIAWNCSLSMSTYLIFIRFYSPPIHVFSSVFYRQPHHFVKYLILFIYAILFHVQCTKCKSKEIKGAIDASLLFRIKYSAKILQFNAFDGDENNIQPCTLNWRINEQCGTGILLK